MKTIIITLALSVSFVCFFASCTETQKEARRLEAENRTAAQNRHWLKFRIEEDAGIFNNTNYTNSYKTSEGMIHFKDCHGTLKAIPLTQVISITKQWK